MLAGRAGVLPPAAATLAKFRFPRATHTVQQVLAQAESLMASGAPVTLHGWVLKRPSKLGKGLVFGMLRDTAGDETQFVVTENDALASSVRADGQQELCVVVSGEVVPTRRRDGTPWDLRVLSFQVLNMADLVPGAIQGSYAPEHRHLQLREPVMQQRLRARATAAAAAREALAGHGFTEVETPVLFKLTPEGAREFLVPTRRENEFYALPQSPQQYKQLLMALGVHRYFQLARCFRDEDLRADRQPEFTQIDLEMSFAEPQDVRSAVTATVEHIWKRVRGLDVYVPVGEDHMAPANGVFPAMLYLDAIARYGVDKPDWRLTVRVYDLLAHATLPNPEYPVFEVCVLRGAFDPAKKPKLPARLTAREEYRNRVPKVVAIRSAADVDGWMDWFTGVEFGDRAAVAAQLELQPGDVVAGSVRQRVLYENPTPLGRFRQVAVEEFPGRWRRTVVDGPQPAPEDTFVAQWVVDFPLFSPAETTGAGVEFPEYDRSSLSATHHPFTMVHPEDYAQLAANPLACHGEHYDLVVNGVELGGGSRRIHDVELQRYVFTSVLGIEDPDYLFGHLLHAFAHGCPPHAGLALGFDRMCAMLVNLASIRDVVAFPKTMSGSDPLVGSPSHVPARTLAEYCIAVTRT